MTDDVDAIETALATTHEGRRQLLEDAVKRGAFQDAWVAQQRCILIDALEWFRDEGVLFMHPGAEHPPSELIKALAAAASREVRSRGDECSVRLEVASYALGAVWELRRCFDIKVEQTPSGLTNWIAEMALAAADLGRMDMFMHSVRSGAFDAWVNSQWQRERRRLGAAKTNSQKATAKENALTEALRISARNATLSAEELAIKIREATQLPTTIKTISEWVREWRRTGALNPLRPPAR